MAEVIRIVENRTEILSPDPVLAANDPTQMAGYDYAGNNPATSSDPTGLAAGSWCVTAACAAAGNNSPGLTGYGITVGDGGAPAPRPKPSPVVHYCPGPGYAAAVPCGSGRPAQSGRNGPDGVGPNYQLTGSGYRSCVTPSPVDDVVSTNHCGWLGLLCDVLPINSAINCWDNPNFDQCATAVIDVARSAKSTTSHWLSRCYATIAM